MKKLTIIGIICCMLFCIAVPNKAMAAETFVVPSNDRYTTIDNVSCKMNISNGNAKLFASVFGSDSITKIEMTVEIQEKFVLFWITKSTWSESVNGSSMQMVRNYAVTSGKTYRVKVKVTVYTASGSETATATSASQKAN